MLLETTVAAFVPRGRAGGKPAGKLKFFKGVLTVTAKDHDFRGRGAQDGA